MDIKSIRVFIKSYRMISIIFILLDISGTYGINSNNVRTGYISKPCWMDLADVEDKFGGEPYDYDGGKAAYLVRQKFTVYWTVLGKCILSERKIVPLGSWNFTTDSPIEILFSPPGTVGWVDYPYNSMRKGPPANALAITQDENTVSFTNSSKFLCRPVFPSHFDSKDVDSDPGIAESGILAFCRARFGFCGKKNKMAHFYHHRILVNPLESGEYDESLQIDQCPKVPNEDMNSDRKLNRLAAAINHFQGTPKSTGDLNKEKMFYVVPSDIKMSKTDSGSLPPFWDTNTVPRHADWGVYQRKNILQRMLFRQHQQGTPCWMDIDDVDDTFGGEGIVPNKFIVRFGKQPSLKYFGEYDLSTKQITPLGSEPNYIPGLDIEILYLPPGSSKAEWAHYPTIVPGNIFKLDELYYMHEYICAPPMDTSNEITKFIEPGTIGIINSNTFACSVRFDVCKRNPKVIDFHQHYVFVNVFEPGGYHDQKIINRCAKPAKVQGGENIGEELYGSPSGYVHGDVGPYYDGSGNVANPNAVIFNCLN